MLPSGIKPSDDPLLSARSAAYSQSFTRRAGEMKAPSAVKTPDASQGSRIMSSERPFTVFSRVLHWLMAAMVLAMLFIGISMVVSVADIHTLVSIHKPLGALIFLLVLVRIANRLLNPPPPLPRHLAPVQRFAAHASHLVLYGLMVAMPLVGWAMLSAARYPIVLFGPVHLPFILPQNAMLICHAAAGATPTSPTCCSRRSSPISARRCCMR
ncbi:MAG: cytochrome b/b6 domain-containing protein [Acetobacteraceae bacterium]